VIHVVAIISAKPGMRHKLLSIFQDNLAKVKAEWRCIEYETVVDADDDPSFCAFWGTTPSWLLIDGKESQI